ncbi:hypothetical protein IWQ48_000599 [Labrenzia sp. EL_13]|nr:hypothetical protein [Labrenzia sp. EL_142]MBG6154776.1 hypothetical protein [Labrenzia sp. EL_162]MBG6193094.1 hypothetical protein [Labrenzia sp. EL_159]MBG6199481.1 hypothetical protein [Labrenzia sp. EL_13]
MPTLNLFWYSLAPNKSDRVHKARSWGHVLAGVTLQTAGLSQINKKRHLDQGGVFQLVMLFRCSGAVAERPDAIRLFSGS